MNQILSRVLAVANGTQPPSGQSIPVSKYLRCYEVLLKDINRTLPLKLASTSLPATVSRSDLMTLAKSCSIGSCKWTDLFVATMMWGYGENDDSGPVKLFRALNTVGADQIIENTAKAVLKERLADAFIEIRKLADIGASYGTKFLYACGTALTTGVRPLVLDRVIAGALTSLYGKERCEELFDLKAKDYTYDRGLQRAAKGYVAYCREMGDLAGQIDWTVDQLEQFLFENAKNL
jgi:hypothetical protein